MGIIVSKDNEKFSKLNQRITADLRERASRTTLGDDPDLVEDSDYTKDLKKTSKESWVWIILVILAIISLVAIALI